MAKIEVILFRKEIDYMILFAGVGVSIVFVAIGAALVGLLNELIYDDGDFKEIPKAKEIIWKEVQNSIHNRFKRVYCWLERIDWSPDDSPVQRAIRLQLEREKKRASDHLRRSIIESAKVDIKWLRDYVQAELDQPNGIWAEKAEAVFYRYRDVMFRQESFRELFEKEFPGQGYSLNVRQNYPVWSYWDNEGTIRKFIPDRKRLDPSNFSREEVILIWDWPEIRKDEQFAYTQYAHMKGLVKALSSYL